MYVSAEGEAAPGDGARSIHHHSAGPVTESTHAGRYALLLEGKHT